MRRKLMFFLLALLAGFALAMVVMMIIVMALGQEAAIAYGTMVTYPIMFIPAMIYAGRRSLSYTFDGQESPIDSFRLEGMKFPAAALLVMLTTLALAFMTDLVSAYMPEVDESVEKALEAMTQGNFLLNFICVSIFAPFFEEWLCRGMVLRNLLSLRVRGGVLSPWVAIALSAAFFALIHGNVWQAVPAFIIGCLMGWVYYRTGSLKLTMLMHFANNTFSLILSNMDSLSEMDNWMDVMPAPLYWIIFAACLLFTLLTVRALQKASR